MLTRRRALQVRTFLARREHYRRSKGSDDNTRAGTPEVYGNSPPIRLTNAEDGHPR